jgi:hypothetical protein
MKLTEKEFSRVATYIKQGRKTAEVAQLCNISERMVQRVREAGTWDRWPYIVAKATHGYNTPEYKLYLKRRGLPLTPPAKYQVSPREKKTVEVRQKMQAELKKRSLLGRLFRRGK